MVTKVEVEMEMAGACFRVCDSDVTFAGKGMCLTHLITLHLPVLNRKAGS
jgi:hypothetical protein